MGRTKRLVLLAASALLAIAAGEVQAQGVPGTYNWEVPTMVRRGGDGSETGSEMAKVTLILEVRGDSVFGTYDVAAPNRPSVPPRVIKGTLKGNTVTFSYVAQARINTNGEERPLDITSTYVATVEGDEIKGTIDSAAADGSINIPQRNFTGKRLKS